MSKVVFHHGLFVAAGTGPCDQDTPTVILRSADGLNWARSTNQGINGFWGVTVATDVIVAVGFWGQTELSSDGINWALNFYQAPGSTSLENLNAVTYGLGRFVAVGDVVATSTNGLNWSAGTVSPPAGGFVTAAYGDGVFWAATPSRLCRSITGTNFFNIVPGAEEKILCFGNHRFLAVGTSLKVSTNVNGWQPTPWPTTSPFDTLTYGAGMFVGTSGRDVATSLDGFNWVVRTNAIGGRALDVTFGNGMFMAVALTNYYTSSPVAALQPAPSPGTLWLHGVKNRDYEIVATNDLSASN